MFTDELSGSSVCLWLVLEVSGVRALLQGARRHVDRMETLTASHLIPLTEL